MQVRYAKKLFDLQDLISGQILFKTRRYGAVVTTLVTRLKWVSLALFDALDSVTCYQGQMMFYIFYHHHLQNVLACSLCICSSWTGFVVGLHASQECHFYLWLQGWLWDQQFLQFMKCYVVLFILANSGGSRCRAYGCRVWKRPGQIMLKSERCLRLPKPGLRTQKR